MKSISIAALLSVLAATSASAAPLSAETLNTVFAPAKIVCDQVFPSGVHLECVGKVFLVYMGKRPPATEWKLLGFHYADKSFFGTYTGTPIYGRG